MSKRYILTEDLTNEIKLAVLNSLSMKEAAKFFTMNYKTFKRLAVKVGCWKPNQCGKGISKFKLGIPLTDILNGFHPDYKSYNLKRKLFGAGLKQKICEECGLGEMWNNKTLILELHHKNGKRHSFDNLQILCPNCHSQTDTYRNRKQ